jgi:hypothetical protein
VSIFLENAQELFDVARAGNASEDIDFALLVGRDGALRFVMDSVVNGSSGRMAEEHQVQYRVTRSRGAVKVEGRGGGQSCVLQQQGHSLPHKTLLRDQALYIVTSERMLSPAP